MATELSEDSITTGSPTYANTTCTDGVDWDPGAGGVVAGDLACVLEDVLATTDGSVVYTSTTCVDTFIVWKLALLNRIDCLNLIAWTSTGKWGICIGFDFVTNILTVDSWRGGTPTENEECKVYTPHWGIIESTTDASDLITVDDWYPDNPTNGRTCICFSVTPAATRTVVCGAGNNPRCMYAWLKAAFNDGDMGALAVDNRRTVWLNSVLTGWIDDTSFLLNTDFVDIASVTVEGTFLSKTAGAGATVLQTADDVRLTNFGIRMSADVGGTSQALILNPANSNAASIYTGIHLRNADATGTRETCSSGTGKDFEGTWISCRGDDFCWRLTSANVFKPTMYGCIGGGQSFGGDIPGGTMAGKYYCCSESGNQPSLVGGSFGSCAQFGMPILSTAEFWYCVSDVSGFGIGKENAGFFFGCIGGNDSFGAGNVASFEGSFSGVAINCIVLGDNGFGNNIGGTGILQRTGQLINVLIATNPSPAQMTEHYANWKDINTVGRQLRPRYQGKYFKSPRKS